VIVNSPTTKTYQDYLHSSQWKSLRATIIRKRGAWCEQCGRTDYLNLHHLTYERLSCELEADLKLLCRNCHLAAHDFNATANARGAKRGAGQRQGSPPPGVDVRKKKQRSRNP
jgi:5-methylcytosine-specific restriction endonuclease McrA